jgi:hypothetical protein
MSAIQSHSQVPLVLSPEGDSFADDSFEEAW